MSRFWFRRGGLRLHRRPGREIAVSAWRAEWRPASEKTEILPRKFEPAGPLGA
jgi:hypothetical protein